MRRAPWPHSLIATPQGEALVCVADPHFTEDDAGALAAFCEFARAQCGNTLVLLGDMFHLFQGPEILREPCWQALLRCLRECARRGRLFFLPGNRDFHATDAFAHATHALVPGESARFLSGERCVYACHGDQLCQGDVAYQRMKGVIRNPLLVGTWMQLPCTVRGVIVRLLRKLAVQSLERKPKSCLVPSREVVGGLFVRGADIVVSGHRHVGTRTEYEVDGRRCVHYELPPWYEERTFLRVRDGVAEVVRFEA